MTTLLLGTYNLWEFMRRDTRDELARYQAVADRIRSYRPDEPLILAVQELSGEDPAETVSQAHALARMAGMECGISHSVTAASFHPSHWSQLAILWRPGIQPVPGSKLVPRPGDADDFLFVSFDVHGVRVRMGTTHFSPFALDGRPDAVRRLAQAARLGGEPTWVGFDFNATPAARRPDGAFYDPDPFTRLPWQPEFSHQCVHPAGGGHEADRRAGEALVGAGLRDVAATLGVPWQATAGFPPHAGGLAMPRRLDLITTTDERAMNATVGYAVDDSPGAAYCSDHLFTVATIDTGALRNSAR